MKQWHIGVGGKTWVLSQGEQWVVSGPMASGKSLLAAELYRRYPEEVALVTFDKQAASAGSDWVAARYYGSIEYDFKTVEEALSYEAVNDINPFEVRPAEKSKRAAFRRLQQWVLTALSLTPLLDRWTVKLSNGEQRRLMLARAILKQTPILVLDDPFAGLDTSMRALLHTLLQALAARGLTLVVMVRNEDEIPESTTHRLKLKALHITSQGRYTPKPQRDITAHIVKKNPPSLKTPVVLLLRDLTLPLEGTTLYHGLNWEVHRGEHWVITGENGSGKTTLFALITGDSPMSYACDIERFGKRLGPGVPLWSIRSRMASVSPELQAFADRSQTVEATVFSGLFTREGARKRPSPSQRKLAITLLTRLGLHEHLHDPLGVLSSGTCRLVFVVRALVAMPELLLLDELCINLEVSERRTLLKLLATLFAEMPELTVLYIAHRREHIPPSFNRFLHLS